MVEKIYTEEQRRVDREQCVQALDACLAEDYEQAKELWECLAIEGNLLAKVDLALLHLRKYIDPYDFYFAVGLLEEASAAGVSTATNELAAVYENGTGVVKNLSMALKLYRITAGQGDARGMFNLGRFYLYGISTEQHTANAMLWLGKAAHLDNTDACYWMGALYRDGRYIEPDRSMASNFYERGASLGHSYCQNKLGIMYRDSDGRDENLEQAFALFELSANSGNEWGQYLLACMYIEGSYQPINLDTARELLTLSARHGLAEAQLELGVIYGKGQGVPVDRIKSIEMYKLAAEQKSATAHFNLGIIYLNGEGIEQDIECGIQHMSQAANLGMDEATDVLVMLKNDHGLESDETPTLQ